MRAALIKSLDGPASIVVEHVAEPVAGPGEIVVRVEAAALNFMDTLISRGRYQVKPPLPFSPAAEVAGVVESVAPDVSRFAAGDRIAAFIGYGGARDKVAVAADRAVVVPSGVSSHIAAAISVTYGTAMHGLRDRGRLLAGETVAVLGASGGVGLAAVEVAALMGARVIAAASGAKCAIARAAGAEHVIDYDGEDLKARLRTLTDGRGVDLVYDCVGGAHAEPALRAMAWQGRYLVVGFAAGAIPAPPLNVVLLRGCDIVGVNWGEAVVRAPGDHRDNMQRLLGWIAEGRLAPRIHAAYPLTSIVEALDLIDQRVATGKVVLDLTL